MYKFEPLEKFHKSVRGALKENELCVLRVNADSDECYIEIVKDGGKPSAFSMLKKDGYFETEVKFQEAGLYFYRFSADGIYIGETDKKTCVSYDAGYFQLLVYDKDFVTPDFIKGNIIYQIFPDRFAASGEVKRIEGRVYHKDLYEDPCFMPDENGKVRNVDFYGGNLKGITEKLDYLKSLSVGIIYLNPIFKARSNHRYDTGDYFEIDPNLGNVDDLITLIKEAAKRDIKIILDGVFSHTGDDSRYFNKYGNYDSVGAYQSKDSPYYKWYSFTEYPDKYASWWGIDVLPETNELEPSYREFITGENGVIEKYLKLGIGGWRLDVADELPDEFLEALRARAKTVDKEAVIIGEVWEDASNKIAYDKRRKYFYGKELDSVMNYVAKNAVIDYVKTRNAQKFVAEMNLLSDHYPKEALDACMNFLGTHDTWRIISSLSDCDFSELTKEEQSKVKLYGTEYDKSVKRLKTAALILYTICGSPSVYYGDEIGQQGLTDPLNRRFFGADGVNGEILSHYILLGKIRRFIPAFKDGELNFVYSDEDSFVYERRSDEDVCFIAVNGGKSTLKITFEGTLYDLVSGEKYENSCEIKAERDALLYKKPL